ncbi:MAG TPA: FKBP-type peptidyl-prolyl cis-trans isomerase [Solirubrobacteraceae bacterium]|nr:FKBP-type peptidyl-prolyl cis-trans isomerase [Solirubrobacteraceae bacterium]
MRRAALILVVSVLVLAGCGGGGKDKSTASTAAAPAATATATAPGAAGAGGTTQLQTKPKVTVPSGKPPTKLVIRDIVKGTGATAQAGDTVSVHYVGVSYANRKQFDASWDRHQPFTFQLGGGMVIPGWDQGIVGMKVNGRRELIIPPALGYGAQGQPPAIAPNDTLVFVIDLLRVQPGSGGATAPAQ